jgi:hypothetical protein
VTEYLDVPVEIVQRVRVACAHLPEADEEPAFAGVRWRIRDSTLAHLVTRQSERGPVTYVTFHAAGEELDALAAMGDPFYPGWGAGLIALVLRDDGTTDWTEVKELLTDSYRLVAPKKLIARLRDEQPDP